MNAAQHEEVQRLLDRLETEYMLARRDYEAIRERQRIMLSGGCLTSANALAPRRKAARDAMDRAYKALRDFRQGRT